MRESVSACRTVRVTFDTAEHADMVRRCTAVDPEVRPNMVRRSSHTEDNVMIVHFAAKDLRSLRVSLGSHLEMVELSVRTIEQLAPETFAPLDSATAAQHVCSTRQELDDRQASRPAQKSIRQN